MAAKPVERKPNRAKPDAPSIVTAMARYGYELPWAKPAVYENQWCEQCGEDRLTITVNKNGGGAWFCHAHDCGWRNEPGEIVPNRRSRRREEPRGFHTLRPALQSLFASLYYEQCLGLSPDALQLIGLDPEHSLGDGIELVHKGMEIDDPRFHKIHNAAVRAFNGVLAHSQLKERTVGANWPPKWAERDKLRATNPVAACMVDLMGMLRDARWAYQRTEREGWMCKDHDGDEFRPVLVEVPFGRVKDVLGLSYTQCCRYLRAMEKAGMIRDSGRTRGRGEQKLWVLGRWNVEGVHRNALYFFKNTPEIRRALKAFRA